jgi:hypothetical protein
MQSQLSVCSQSLVNLSERVMIDIYVDWIILDEFFVPFILGIGGVLHETL